MKLTSRISAGFTAIKKGYINVDIFLVEGRLTWIPMALNPTKNYFFLPQGSKKSFAFLEPQKSQRDFSWLFLKCLAYALPHTFSIMFSSLKVLRN